MSLQVVWTRQATSQLYAIHDYILGSNATAAETQVRTILRAADQLGAIPQLGRKGRRAGTRELVISGTPYIVAYRVALRVVEILAVVHGARRWPKRFGG